uniref:cystathionine gamma-lyase n=1 Tax=Odontella aurita TaxID=265563 RepID=A0A7S4HK91_9STRA|mmetsp:Transcript_11367/g.33472  ORF Transcript_11367/g.33472 Transcript_11367/m.33472 type:complete len:460 (+) Transcript_11367:378-1757(+)
MPNEAEDDDDAAVQSAIAAADPYRGRGTTYLHTPAPKTSSSSASDGNNSGNNPTGAVVPPISLSTTFAQSSPGAPSARADPNSFGSGYEYSRTGNPTRGEFERSVAAAEGAEYAVAFSSGSAATSAVVHLMRPGERILCVDDVYGGTQRYFRRIVNPGMGIEVDFVDFNDEGAMRGRLDAGCKAVEKKSAGSENGHSCSKKAKVSSKTKLLWLETPTNPTLKVSSIRAAADLAHERGALLAVDNTFCSPYFQNPLEHGADLVVHSVTKYIGGHSDVVMGVVCTSSEDLYSQLRFVQNGVGAVPSPFDCYLAHRGLKTLHVRMEAAAKNALAIALFLESHKAVAKAVYPGLKSHPQHRLASEQQSGYGAMITFYVRGGREQSRAFLEHLKVFALAESLGAVESLAECPSLMTHASVPDERRELLGIDDALVRLSVGIESCRDLIEDLGGALAAAFKTLEE